LGDTIRYSLKLRESDRW